MRARSLLLFAVGLLAACGGAAANGKNGAKSPNGSNGGDSIADEASKNGGIAGAGIGGGTSSQTTAGSLELQLLDPATPVKLDGVPLEWPARTAASQSIRGDGSSIALATALQYDDNKI